LQRQQHTEDIGTKSNAPLKFIL